MAGEEALVNRLQELFALDPSQGYRALHAKLKEEPQFEQVGLKKVQTLLRQIREAPCEAPSPAPAAAGRASDGENIWSASSDGDIARVEELMAVEGLTPTSADENGYTPVHAAASWGRLELLRLLLAKDVTAANVRDSDGDTPLHHVAGASELGGDTKAIVELLLDSRADPTLRNHEGKTCIDACVDGSLDEEEGELCREEVEVNVEFIKVLKNRGYEVPGLDAVPLVA